jgi:hypothetical protein
MMIQTQLTTIIGLGMPGHEDAQHLIVQVIHGCLMARGRGSYSQLVCLLCSNPLGASISRAQVPLHRRDQISNDQGLSSFNSK